MNTSGSVLDTPFARIVAAAAALGFAAAFLFWAAADVSRPFAARQDRPTPAAELPVVNANPTVVACLDQRLGEVETMRTEGIIDDAQYDLFRTRATNYCHAQGAAR